MQIQHAVAARLAAGASQSALRTVKTLVACYLGISIVTMVAVVLLRDNTAIVTPAVWIRGTIVVASAILMTVFNALMARGSRMGYIRLRIVSAIMPLAIVTIIALPGLFPLWMKIEQGVCGLLLLGVVIIVNGKTLRSAFASK